MQGFTVCTSILERAKSDKSILSDILFAFVPTNSKVVCIDNGGKMIEAYNDIISSNKDLADWYRFLNMNPENIQSIEITNHSISDIKLNVCNHSFDKLLITSDKSNYSSFRDVIKKNDITIYDKNSAQFRLNYDLEDFPKTEPSIFNVVSVENFKDVLNEVVNEFKDVVENKGLWKLFYDDKKKPQSEKKAQLLFFGVAYSHCKANDLKICPESDNGNGPVDFNLSIGFKVNGNVEMKLASNSSLVSGYWNQLSIYNSAENSLHSVYLIVKTCSNYDDKIEDLLQEVEVTIQTDISQKYPKIVVVDAQIKESASKRKSVKPSP